MITVDEMMTTEPTTLLEQDSLADVQSVMTKFSCHHVPIVDEKNALIGLVSQRDVLRVTESSLVDSTKKLVPEETRVADFMTRDVFTIQRGIELRQAALHIRTKRYGCLPVVDNGLLVGLITDSDFVNIAIDLLEQLENLEPDELD